MRFIVIHFTKEDIRVVVEALVEPSGRPGAALTRGDDRRSSIARDESRRAWHAV